MITTYDLDIRAGGTTEFVVDVIGGPSSLSGYTGLIQFRPIRGSVEVLGEVEPPNIVVNDITSQVTVRIPGELSLEWDFSHAVYDLLLSHVSGDPWVLVQGHVRLYPFITSEV
jgi:hypothetical protein